MKPLLLGYLSQRGTTTPAGMRAGRTALQQLADREGFALGDVFIEIDCIRRASALPMLIQMVLRTGAEAVGVPALADLGRTAEAQFLMRHRIEQMCAVRVLVVETAVVAACTRCPPSPSLPHLAFEQGAPVAAGE